MQRQNPEARYHASNKPTPVSNAEESTSLYAVGMSEVPWTFTGVDGQEVENWFNALVVPGLAWDGPLEVNHLEDTDAVTQHSTQMLADI